MADIAALKIKVDTKEVKSASSDLNQLQKSSGGAESSVSSLATRALAVTAAFAGIAAALKQTINTATEFQNAINGLASVARYAGEEVSGTLNQAMALTSDGMLSTAEAATALKNLLARGFTTDEAVEMINRFKDAAAFGRQSSLEFGQAVVSATEGIKNENSVLVDNAGVTKNVSIMWKEYASQIGKSVNNLSMAEKRQAEYNGILRETEGQLGNAEIAANGVDGANARLRKSFTDLSVTIGQSLTPAYVDLVNVITDGFNGVSENVIKPFLFLFNDIGISAAAMAEKIGAVWDVMLNPRAWGTLQQRLRGIEDLAEEMRIEAAARISGQSITPVMGKDSGLRRQDFIIPEQEATKKAQETINKAATDLASSYSKLLQQTQELGQEEMTQAERLQVLLDSYTDLDPAVKQYVQNQINAVQADERRRESIALMVENQIYQAKEEERIQEERRQRIAEIVEGEKKKLIEQKESFKELQNAVEGFSRNATNAFVDFAFGAETSFKGMVDTMLRELARLTLQKSIFDPLVSGITDGISSGGGIGGLFKSLLPGFANGTDYVPRDMIAKIHKGERIVTAEENRKGYGTGQVNNVSIVINEGSRQENGDSSKMAKAIEQAVMGVLMKQKRQGGLLGA